MMKTMMMAFLLALAGGTATAQTATPPSVEAIRSQQAQIRSEAAARSGRYKDMPEDARNDLAARQGEVETLLQGKARIEDLTENDRVALFNALEAIEAILNKAEDERMVCTRETPVGTNRPKVVCRTVAQRRAEAEAARNTLDNANRNCNSPTGMCGGGG